MILEVNLSKLESNTREITSRCEAAGVTVAGVVKGCGGLPECALAMEAGGCSHIASSRLGHLERARAAGARLPMMMIRIPGASEAERVVRAADISLNSEASVLRRLDEAAGAAGLRHGVVLMAELGDLREGIWNEGEMRGTALLVEREMKNLRLLGIGVNLGCYGSIAPTAEKMEELAALARRTEEAIGRGLEMVSGGASTSFPRILDGDMPRKINNLRIGENILTARDLEDLWGYRTDYLHKDVFVMKAEVLEVKEKPTHPIGEIMFDAFRNKPVYVDRGVRRRAIVAAGKLDYGWPEQLVPLEPGVEVIGASSDHTILDVEDAGRALRPGDVLSFAMCYAPMAYLSSAPDTEIVFVR
ncbi:MAG: alanine racemase [Clostridiales Family XIII bacterium]|jgi:predicted amino acid racemase|nr:alanine racemase [Clostridiales Family XIII bacterium]